MPEPRSIPEMRWTRGPKPEQDPAKFFLNNLPPAKASSSGRKHPQAAAGDGQLDPHPVTNEEHGSKVSRAALLELCVRILSWTAAAAAFSSAIYVSVHVESLRQAAAIGQLAALIPLIFDSIKLFNLIAINYLTKPSSGRLWYANLIMAALSGVTCSFFWRFGVRDGVFDPFGKTSDVTVAIALMATSGAFRFIWFITALKTGLTRYFSNSGETRSRDIC